MGKPRIPSLLLNAQLFLPLACISLALDCHGPVEVKKGDYLLHATPQPLPEPAPGPPAPPPPKADIPPQPQASPDPEYHAE